MKFSLLYTSRRPHSIRNVVNLWVNRALDRDQLEFIFAADEDDRETALVMLSAVNVLKVAGIAAKGPFASPLPGDCVKGWNTAASQSTGDWLIAISDDFEPPEGWDHLLSEFIAFHGDAKTKDSAIMVSDGIHPPEKLIQSLGILSRGRYDRLGYMCYPGYRSMFDDTERGFHANIEGRLLMATHLFFHHHHHIVGERKMDGVDRVHGSPERYHESRRIFEARKSLGFPVDAGQRAPRLNWHDPQRFIAYYLVTGLDFGLAESVERLFEEGVRDFFFSVPDRLWNNQCVPEDARVSVAAIAGVAREHGARVWWQDIRLGKYAAPGLKYGDTEARVRNAALEEMTRLGFRDVLIVDGDELWRPGTLNKLGSMLFACEDQPAYVLSNCIPVANGFPVEGASDSVGVYIDAARNRFLTNRSPYLKAVQGKNLNEGDIFHFTATHESAELLARKMRTSAHYDDPDYAFEDWLFSTLPRIRPGAKNVHMYGKGRNVWPMVRAWSAEELEDIPDSILPFLAH